MNDIEIIDLMLKFDFEKNSGEHRGYITPSRLFDELRIPLDRRSFILGSVLELDLFEYNTPKIGIRASYKGRKIYEDGGYRLFTTIESIKKWINRGERIANFLKPL